MNHRNKSFRHAGHLELVKIIRESQPLQLGPDGRTIGQLIDMQLHFIAAQGEEVQSLTVHVDESYWQELAEQSQVNHAHGLES